MTGFSPTYLLQQVEESRIALDHGNFARALDLSQEISDYIDRHQVPSILETDGAKPPYTIVVVGYKKVPDHVPLVKFLQSIDNRKFEIIFVENAGEPVFEIDPDLGNRNIKVLRLGANLGVGVARNIAIKMASGNGIILIDDDGETDEKSLEALTELFEAAQATAVRGMVSPKTTSNDPPPHYSPGNQITQRFCDIEGMSIWRKSEMLRVRIFDPILYGHEGIDLTARLYPLNGPEAFLYQPKAVLMHDFSRDPGKVEEKRARYEKIEGYLTYKNPDYKRVLNVFYKAPRDLVASALLKTRFEYVNAACRTTLDECVSFITTCYNGAEFISEFVDGLVAQTDRNFELIFVDDGSSDGSADLIEELLPSHISRRIIRSENKGRSAALNQAVAAAGCDICLIADIDDVPLPQRVAWSKCAFEKHPDAAMIGFMIFDVNSHARASRPFPHRPIPLSLRSLFGMPTPFPGFSFRKSKLLAKFDETLSAGVDCDWIFRSIMNDGCDGYLIPLNVTFYRTHPGQITSSRRHIQRATSLRYLQEQHDKLLGVEGSDSASLELFAGWAPIKTGPDYWRVHDYALKLLKSSGTVDNTDIVQLRQEICNHLNTLHLNLNLIDRQNLKNKIGDLEGRVREAEERVRQAEGMLDGMYTSTSWYLTKPFRVVKQIVSRR